MILFTYTCTVDFLMVFHIAKDTNKYYIPMDPIIVWVHHQCSTARYFSMDVGDSVIRDARGTIKWRNTNCVAEKKDKKNGCQSLQSQQRLVYTFMSKPLFLSLCAICW